MISKLEQRVQVLESDLDSEQRRHQDAVKGLSKSERRIRELLFQVDEDKKASHRLQDLVEKLQNKLKIQKRQIEEAVRVSFATTRT